LSDRTKLLIHFRRISGLFDSAIRNGPDGSLEGKFSEEHPQFTHHTLGFYLLGCLAYLEGEDGVYSWNKPSAEHLCFDKFAENYPQHPERNKTNYKSRGITQKSLDALACIRNAIAHNNGDLNKNNDKNSFSIVSSAKLPGVELKGSIVFLKSEFLEFVRIGAYAVRHYHGET